MAMMPRRYCIRVMGTGSLQWDTLSLSGTAESALLFCCPPWREVPWQCSSRGWLQLRHSRSWELLLTWGSPGLCRDLTLLPHGSDCTWHSPCGCQPCSHSPSWPSQGCVWDWFPLPVLIMTLSMEKNELQSWPQPIPRPEAASGCSAEVVAWALAARLWLDSPIGSLLWS